MAHAEEVGEALLHRSAFLAERQPEIQGGADGGLDLFRPKDARGVRYTFLGRIVRRTRGMVSGKMPRVDGLRV